MFGGRKVKGKNGREFVWLTPAGKGKKFAHELREGYHMTNAGEYKADEDGPFSLTDAERAYRSGYLAARRDSAKVWKYNQSKGKGDSKKK